MNQITGRSFLEQVVGSYLGALVQREHIKNKRLDDIVTTSGNYQQASLQSSIDRVNQKLGSLGSSSGMQLGPQVDYGDMPRQLGVTPYPQPPSSVNVNEETSNEQHHVQQENSRPQSPEKEKPPSRDRDFSSRDSGKGNYRDADEDEEYWSKRREERRYHETSKKNGFPWKETLLGTALAASVATNGALLYSSRKPEPSPQQPQQTQPSSVGFSPSLNIHEDRGMGSVSIGVE